MIIKLIITGTILTIAALVEISSWLCDGYPIPSRSNEMKNAATVLLSVIVTFIILRLCSRFMIARKLWWDDWTIILAGVCTCIFRS